MRSAIHKHGGPLVVPFGQATGDDIDGLLSESVTLPLPSILVLGGSGHEGIDVAVFIF